MTKNCEIADCRAMALAALAAVANNHRAPHNLVSRSTYEIYPVEYGQATHLSGLDGGGRVGAAGTGRPAYDCRGSGGSSLPICSDELLVDSGCSPPSSVSMSLRRPNSWDRDSTYSAVECSVKPQYAGQAATRAEAVPVTRGRQTSCCGGRPASRAGPTAHCCACPTRSTAGPNGPWARPGVPRLRN